MGPGSLQTPRIEPQRQGRLLTPAQSQPQGHTPAGPRMLGREGMLLSRAPHGTGPLALRKEAGLAAGHGGPESRERQGQKGGCSHAVVHTFYGAAGKRLMIVI